MDHVVKISLIHPHVYSPKLMSKQYIAILNHCHLD